MLSSHKSLLSVALSATLLAGMTSCQDEDFGYTAQEIAYKTNFEKVYGKIPADKSWDLSSWANWKAPVSSSKTRAEGGSGTPTKGKLQKGTHFTISETTNDNDYYVVPNSLLSWLDGHLLEGNDNRFLGSSFVLKLPENDFAIIPIYQGNSAIHSELELKINDYEITKIWEKSDGIQGFRKDGTQWEDVKYWAGYSAVDKVDTKTENDKLVPYAQYHSASTIGDKSVRSKPIVFHRSQINTSSEEDNSKFMYLSLRNTAKSPVPQGATGHWSDDGKWIIDTYKTETVDEVERIVTKMWDEDNTWTTIGDRLTSVNPDGYMLALNVPLNQRPSAEALANLLPDFKTLYDAGSIGAPQALIIGCEDANGVSSDHDMNDIVFLIVGYPDIPQVIPTTHVIEKRYLCEDLGATNDFDFNDVVVDVKQTMEYELSYVPSTVPINGFFNTVENPSATPSVEITDMVAKPDTKVQTARISHVCGTLPIQVQVGDYLFPWIMDPTDKQRTREDLMKGGWKYNETNGQWNATSRQTPTRAAYPVEEEGWNPNEERIVWGWDNLSNNIRVYVQWPNSWGTPKTDNIPQHKEDTGNELLENHNWAASNPYIGDRRQGQVDFLDLVEGDRHVENVTFPRNGVVPYIIATDPDFPWMKECQDIMRKWLTDGRIDPNDPEYSHVAGPGSGAYYEILPEEYIDRAIIWSGKSGGERLANGVEFKAGTSEQLGLKEAIEQGYNTINVYTSGVENGWVGLCYIDTDGSWKTLYASEDADSYKADENVSMGGETWYKASIRLTDHQQAQIKANGFVLQSYTNALVLRALDLTKKGGYTVKLTDPAVDTEENNHSIMGVITANDHARERDGAMSGGRIPFAEAMFIDGENCVLTAEPKLGYKFDRWSDNNTENPRTIRTSTASALTAHFSFHAPTAEVNLDSKYYHKWSSYKDGAHISSPNQSSQNNSVGTDASQFDDSRLEVANRGAVYGGGRVSGDEYVDLSASNVLVLTAPKANNYRFLFNRQSNDNQGTDVFVLNSAETGAKYMTVHVDDDTKTIIVDLAAIKKEQGYVHLNSIKNASNGSQSATSIKVDALTCDKDAAFAQLYTDWDATRNHTASLNKALSFYQWSSDDVDAHIIGQGTRYPLALSTVGEHDYENRGTTIAAKNGICATIIGNTWNQANIYADLSNADAHFMVIDAAQYTGVPRLWFNNQSLTFLADDPAYGRIYKGNTGGAYHYVINLDKIRTEKGKVHLNSITTDYQNSCIINNVWVLQTCAKATAWEAAMTAVKDMTFSVDFASSVKDNQGNAPTLSFNNQIDLYSNSDNTTNWIDLASSHWMHITLPEEIAQRKNIRLFFNKSDGTRLDVVAGSDYIFIKDNNWYVDLDAIKSECGGQVQLRAIKGPDYSTPATITSITLDEYIAPVSNRTLTLSCDDSDYKLYVNGNQVTSASVAVGSTVTVKAVNPSATVKMKDDKVYCFSWSGVDGVTDSFDNEERSFSMPDANTTLTITPLYKLQPQTHLGSTAKYDNSLGTITTTWNGRTSSNTAPIYVTNGSQVQATYTEKPGYAFKVWKYSNGKKDNPYTVTKNDSKTSIDYAPQAEYTEADEYHKWTGLSITFDNSEAQSYKINKPGDGMNAIGIQFNNENVGTVHIFCDTWNRLQSNIKVTNGYVVIRLTEETLNAINNGTQPFIQILGPEGVDLKSTKIIAVYEFAL